MAAPKTSVPLVAGCDHLSDTPPGQGGQAGCRLGVTMPDMAELVRLALEAARLAGKVVSDGALVR